MAKLKPKYSSAICAEDHTGDLPQKLIESLPEYQGHPVRHRCAGCSYIAGLNEAQEDIARLVGQIQQLTAENEKLRAKLDSRDT